MIPNFSKPKKTVTKQYWRLVQVFLVSLSFGKNDTFEESSIMSITVVNSEIRTKMMLLV